MSDLVINADTVNVYVTVDDERLARIEAKIDELTTKENQQMADLTRLQNDVQSQTTVVQSVQTLVAGLAQQIRDLSTDPAALEALADQIEQNSSALGQLVTDNTPASGA